jgi:hypothetical protein
MLPDNILFNSTTIVSSVLAPDNNIRRHNKEDFEIGPASLTDLSKGLMFKPWRVWTDGLSAFLAPVDNQSNPNLLFSDINIREVSFAFDQLARPQVVYISDTTCKFWFFDSTISAQNTMVIPGATSPILTLDDKRVKSASTSDVLLFYIKAGALFYRQQRERYEIERNLMTLPGNVKRLVSAGMSTSNRLQVNYSTLT